MEQINKNYMSENSPNISAEEMAAESDRQLEADRAQALGGLAIERDIVLYEDVTGSDENGEWGTGEQEQLSTIRPEDEGRIHDIELAREQARNENEIFDVWEAAHVENKMFDLYTEALKEDEERTQKLHDEASTDKVHLKENSEPNSARTEQGIRKQAEVALRDAGYKGTIPAESRVRLDHETGNLMIIGNHEVKVVEPQPNGKSRVTEYGFDESSNVLTISAHGANTITAIGGDYMPSPIGKDELKTKEIVLPVAVAQVIGFRRAIPIPVRVSKSSLRLAA